MIKQSELTKALALLRAAYPAATLLKQTPDVYEHTLGDISAPEVQRAVYEHIATSNWFPTVSELRERVARHRVGAPSATVALQNVIHNRKPLHKITMAALGQTGGRWEMRRSENATAWRAQFRDAYNALVAAAVEEQNLAPMLLHLGVETAKQIPERAR